ncbi:MAG: type II secretion system protein J, partial [Candidatus Omnitrophota bacterium]
MRDDKKHSSAKIKMLGLSLIEVMVAVTIFSFLSVSLYMLLRTGIFVRKRLSVDGRNREKSYLVLERVSRELRNAVKFTNRETGFFGKGDSLKFYALTFDYAHNLPRVSA